MPEHRLDLSVDQFKEVSDLIYNLCRIQLPIEKINLVRGRLLRRMADLNLVNVDQYIATLKNDLKVEMPFLISSMTTNVTSFFREQRQIDFLADKIAPRIIDKAQRGEPVRIWSAGCSTGEEPYTIAAVLLASYERAANINLKILATDIDRKAVAYARRGKYEPEAIAAIPHKYRDYLFRTNSDTVCDYARKMIIFNELNLFADWEFSSCFDVILCRNVCIYFDAHSCAEVWRKLSGRLHSDGFLFVGSSEKISNFDSLGLRYFGDGVYGKMQGKIS